LSDGPKKAFPSGLIVSLTILLCVFFFSLAVCGRA
jgi:hypothetical protein